MVGGDVAGNLVHQRFYRIDHVAGHAAGGTTLETVEIMRLTHVVLTALAIAAFPARDDLLGNHAVAHRDPPSARGFAVEFDNFADEFMSGDDHGLRPGRAVLIAPEFRRAVVALQVAGADPDGLHPDQRFARFAFGHRDLFESVVVRSVADHGLHLLGDLFGHQQAPGASFRLVTIRLPDCGWSHTIA